MSLKFLKSYESLGLGFLKSYESMSLKFLKSYESMSLKNPTSLIIFHMNYSLFIDVRNPMSL
jgi:hypothetical protein